MSNHPITNFGDGGNKIRDIFSKNCVLYFPSNRFEEPAWLNEENLRAKAEYMDVTHRAGHTSRRVINYSPLRDIQDWLFGVIYDGYVLERTTDHILVSSGDNRPPRSLEVVVSNSGSATSTFKIVVELLRKVMRAGDNMRLLVGTRTDRAISLEVDQGLTIPNIFQLSSGEMSLLTLFFSILRDFDLSRASIDAAGSVRGIAVVDEIDLHLHAVHQHEVLPELMKMFPRVQFIVSTHSPLFVLGMRDLFGEDGFGLYQLPDGGPIDPEELSEFHSAYQTYTETSKFSGDIRAAVKNAQTPLLYLEGTTDCDYLTRAAELLGRTSIVKKFRLEDANGAGGLGIIWKNISKLPDELVPTTVVLLYDSDQNVECLTKFNRFKRKIPHQSSHPIEKGIENLFDKTTLDKARRHNKALVDIGHPQEWLIRGEDTLLPEEWIINKSEKSNLCGWLCENGTAKDFRHFGCLLDMLAEILDEDLIEE